MGVVVEFIGFGPFQNHMMCDVWCEDENWLRIYKGMEVLFQVGT
jgi:hypothetical protein